MPLAAALMMLTSTVTVVQPVTPEALIATFETICVAPSSMAAQRKAASTLPNVTSKRIAGEDKHREPLVPGTEYYTPSYEIGVFGYANAGLCWVGSHLAPDMGAKAFVGIVGGHFGKEPHKEVATDAFYRAGWVTGKRQYAMEWQHKDGNVIGLLSVSKRDGFSG